MSAIRRISEDARFRPFLTSHFDSEGYIRSVIKDGKSEEVHLDLETCIAEVNEEIKGYISLHKHDLMCGMQDVAVLAARYQTLQTLSSRVRAAVDRLKKETVDTHTLVQLRTMELERIHTTGTMLRQLRQFAHALAQLEHYGSTGSSSAKDSKDIRQYTSAAKILRELEQLLEVPQLMAVLMVSEHAAGIRSFGKQLREASKERLLAGLRDRNQAVVADCLQIFFNLNSMPEIVLLAVDNAVRVTSDVSTASIDLDVLVSIQPDLAASGLSERGHAASTRGSSSVPGVGAHSSGGLSKGSAEAARVLSQLRVAMRDIAHLWSTKVFEQALQVHVLQRVVTKKEDPSTHVRFVEVLKPPGVKGLSADFSSGDLLEFFYSRLVVSLQDVISEKIKRHPLAAARIYPSLRKAAADVSTELRAMASKHSHSTDDLMLSVFSGHEVGEGGGYRSLRANACFGSLSWTLEDSTFGQMAFNTPAGVSSTESSSMQKMQRSLVHSTVCSGRVGGDSEANRSLLAYWPGLGDNSEADSTEDVAQQGLVGKESFQHSFQERGLLEGLRPMRDRYLVGVFSRITAPIHQMFPELEGYTAAVPSKRDLMSFVKAVQAELVDAANEGDAGLIRFVCRELAKAVQLLTTKIEGMVQTTPDTKKMDPSKNFARSAPQDHNYQLMVLLTQLRDAVEKLPLQVVKLLDEIGASADTDQRLKDIQLAISSSNSVSIERIDNLAGRLLIAPLVDAISEYFRGVILGLYKEGNSAPSAALPRETGETQDGDCSRTIQAVLAQFPEAVRLHLLSLPRHPAVLWGVDEACKRIMVLYVSTVVLIRPMTELTRLRTSAEMTAIELMISSMQQAPSHSSQLLPSQKGTLSSSRDGDAVRAEFKSLRRLLFEEHVAAAFPAGGPSADSMKGTPFLNSAPSAEAVLALPYIRTMRPSSLLGYLFSCGPTQLPPPFVADSTRKEKDTHSIVPLGDYVEQLTGFGADLGQVGRGDAGGASPSDHLSTLCIARIYQWGPDWRKSPSEANAWALMQKSLELLLQRSAVMPEASRAPLRQWYEALCTIGASLFSPNGALSGRGN